MSLYAETVPALVRMLTNLEAWIDTALEHAKKKGYDPQVLLGQRLAPDQFPLVKQIQTACDHAKFAVSRVSGKETPSHPDTEQTWDEIRARIHRVREYVQSFQESDFAGAETRVVPLRLAPGKGMLAPDYVREMAMPNFWFHVTTAYAILRHNGVELGKRDYVGRVTLRDL
jgi:hypothetical protein